MRPLESHVDHSTDAGEKRRHPCRRWAASTIPRRVFIALASAFFLTAIALFAIGCYFSNRLEHDAFAVRHEPPNYDMVAASVAGNRITLSTTSRSNRAGMWQEPGLFGLEWTGGYGQVGEIQTLTKDTVVRDFKLLEGSLEEGTAVRVDSFAFPSEPLVALGLPFEDVMIPGPLGDAPAWYVPASSGAWAILLHGHGASRRDSLRSLRAVNAAGLQALVITYRNDEGAPAAPDGRYHYGESEWADLEAAAQYAVSHGARSLVLVGNSMGGGIVMSFLYRSSLAANVTGVILDSPMLNFRDTVRHRAKGTAPEPLITYGMRFSAIRLGIDWKQLDYLRDTSVLHAPILLFHGDNDSSVPLATSQELRRLRPDLVRLVSWPGVGHVRSWNYDPDGYLREVREFLAGPAVARGE